MVRKKGSNIQKVCPHCGSPGIEYASLEVGSGSIVGLGVPEKYYCDRCGYTGSVILEMTAAQRRKRRFKKTAYKRPKRYGYKKSAEVLKPIYSVVLVLFFITALIFLFPKYDLLEPYERIEIPTAISSTGEFTPLEPVAYTESGSEVYIFGQQYITVRESGLKNIENALGYSGVSDFLVPLFFTFFVTGFIAMMIASHWQRVRLFS